MQRSLWDTIRIRDLELPNRAVMPAMGTGYSSEKGEATDRLIAYLRRRAEGGVGLIITEVCAVHPLGKGFPSELGIYNDSFLPSLERLAREVKAAGSAVAVQLHHAGRETFPQVIGEQPVAPSPLASRAMGQKPRDLSKEEIAELIGCYAAAAVRAREAGFDAVEIHGAHGYLVGQFLSPYSNQREDEYGGDAQGRFRFAVEMVREMRREVGEGFPIIFRFSSTEALKDGYDLEYILPLLPILEEEGVDAFHVSCGVFDSPGNPTCPGLHHPPGINVDRAAAVKEEVNAPVIVVGKLHDPRLADEVISQGKADMVAFGRQHLADPHFLRKAAAGKYEDIRFCLSCNQGCIERLMFEFKSTTCTINPECGRELKSLGKRPGVKGPFLVVGAGAAGLQAAMDLREAGVEVELMEREKEAGGQLRAASQPPGKEPYAEWVEWAERRLSSLGSQIKLGQEAGIETLKKEDWRGVIAATGAKPVIPSLPGADYDINAEAREVLLGKRETGKRVLIVGAGPVGMETADYLIQKGCQVTVVEEMDHSTVILMTSHGSYLHRILRKRGELLLNTRVVQVTQKGAIISTRGEEREMEADTVVWAVGSVPELQIVEAARELGIVVKVVGDAVEPRRLLEAVHEAHQAVQEFLDSSPE